MTSDGRKDITTKLKEDLAPNAMKSDSTKLKESGTGTVDRIAREIQPDSTKSGTQEAFDKTERGKDNVKHGSTHETIGDKVKGALGMTNKDHKPTS